MSSARHDHAGIDDAELIEVADGVFGYIQPDGSWFINNTGFVAGSAAVVAIDSSSTERRTRAMIERIASVTPAPVRTLVNTHSHPDHTNGNYLFADATIVAHELTRAEMLRPLPPMDGLWEPVEWGELRRRPPELTFRDSVTIWSDEIELQVRYVGSPAHTTNDSIIWLPARRVLFAGDLVFNGGTPFILAGSVAGAIDVLDNVVRPIPAEVIVPGHGAPCGPGIIDDMLAYLRFLQETALAGHAAGLSPLEAARQADLGPFAGLLDAERLAGNLHRAYAELGGAPRGAGIDMAAAFADMIAYNGGKPLSCYA
jgi:cyclase